MGSNPESHPLLTRLLQSQVVNLAVNDTAMKEDAESPNNRVYFKGRTSFQQTAYLHQGAGSQWPAAQNTSSCIYYTSNGLQVNCSQDNFYQDSRFINSHPPQSSLQKPKADYLQQNVPAQQKPQGANQWNQYNVWVPKCGMKDSHSSQTGMTVKPALPSSTTATLPPYQQRVNTGQCESLTHNNHCNRENNTQQATGYYHRPHSYITQSQQPSRDNFLKNMPIQQGAHVPCMGQRTQQHPAQISPMFHSKEDNTHSDKDKTIARIIDSLKNVCPVNQDVCTTANNSSLYRGVLSSITTQPMPTNTSNTRQSSVFIPGETLPEYISVILPIHDMAGSSQRTPYVPRNVLKVPMIDQNKSVGKELRNSQSPETPPSATEENYAVNSPSGLTNSKAIAVVQPLSQQSCQVSSNHEALDAVGYKSAVAGSCESLPEVSEKTVYAQELSSRLAGKTLADEHDAQMTPPSDVPRSQSCESAEDPEASVSMSSGPTVTWTIKELQKLIETEETTQQKWSDLVDGRIKLGQLFAKNLRTYEARKDLFRLLRECKIFLNRHITPDTVLEQLKPGVEKQRYQILGDNDLYTEPPFTSMWLNINDQLDDIDKEFGFPPCLRCTRAQKMDNQMDLVAVASITPEHTDCEVSEKDLKQAEPRLTEYDVEKHVESSPIRAASPDDTQDGDSPDPCYSFKIQVLSPEEAKLIYERPESPEQHSVVARVENQDSDRQPEKDACSSVAGDVPDLSFALLNETDCPIEEVCCLSKLVGNIFESNPPLVKCQCNAKKSIRSVIDITESDSDDSVTEIMDIYEKSPCEVIIVIENKNDNPSRTDDASLYPKIDAVYACADSESIPSIISAACDSKIENPGGSDIEICKLISEGEDKKLSDVSSDSSVETKEQTPVSTKSAPLPDVNLTGQSKRESKPETPAVFPLFKESSPCNLTTKVESQLSTRPEVSVDTAMRKHLDSNSKAAQLVLFGSVQSPGKTYKRKRHFSSEGAVCTSSKPPEVLSVPLRSMKRQFSEPLPVQEQSVKNKIFEIWRKSFPVKSLNRQGKNTQRSALSLRAPEKQAVSPEKKKLKLLDLSQRPSDGFQCRMETKCISPGEL